MPSHEPLGSSFARLLQRSRITAQTAVPVVTGIVITLFSFSLSKVNSHCSFLFFSFYPLSAPHDFLFVPLFFLLVSVLVFLVFGTTPSPHVQPIKRGRRGRKYRKLKVKRVALLSSVSSMNTFYCLCLHKV